MNTTTDTSPQFGKPNTKEKIFKILNLSVPILMGIFIFFNPFPHTTSIKEICFYGSVVIILILICFKKIDFSFKSPLTIPFALFTAWAFIGLFFALDKGNSLHDFRAHLLKYLAIYYILINFFNSRKRFIILTWIIVISAAAFSFGAITYSYIALDYDFSSRFVFSYTTYRDYIYVFALLLSFGCLLSDIRLYSKAILLICIFGTGTVTLLLKARGTLLAIVLSLFILSNKNKKFLFAIIIILLIGVKITPGYKDRFAITHFLRNERIGINLTSLEIIKSYPIKGIGFGMQTYGNKNLLDLEKYNARIPPKYRQNSIIAAPHNSLIDVAVRTGLVGLALFLYIQFAFVRMGWKVIRHGRDDFIRNWGVCLMACFIAYFTQSIFGDATFGLQAIVFYTILAMMTILWRLDNVKLKQKNKGLP